MSLRNLDCPVESSSKHPTYVRPVEDDGGNVGGGTGAGVLVRCRHTDIFGSVGGRNGVGSVGVQCYESIGGEHEGCCNVTGVEVSSFEAKVGQQLISWPWLATFEGLQILFERLIFSLCGSRGASF